MFTDIINALNDPNGQILLALNFALIMQLLGALLAVAIDPYMKKDNRRRAAMTRLSTDRESILGGLTSGDNTKRDKLG